MQKTNISRTRRIISTFFRLAIVLQVVVIIIILGASVYKDPPCIKQVNELGRIMSPDNRISALLITEHCYLSDDYSTIMYLLPVDNSTSETEDINPIIYEKNIDILDNEWLSPNEIRMLYEKNDYRYMVNVTIED